MKIPRLIVALVLTTTSSIAHAQDARPLPTPAQGAEPAPEQSFFNDPNIIDEAFWYGRRLIGSSDGGEFKNGFYPEFGEMIPGAGWISAGPGYRHWLLGDRLFVDGSAALSWRMYKMAQARVELPTLARNRVIAGAQLRWQDLTQVTYFGAGAESLETDRSEYRMTSANIVGYVTGRPARWLSIKGKVGWITRPSIQEPGGTFERGYPDTRTVFPDDPVYQLDEQPNFLHGEVAIVADTRDHRGYPSEGGLYQASWSRYADREIDRFGFQRYEAEAAHFFPVSSHRIVLFAHGWLAGSRADDGQAVPFYLLPSLGGSGSLRSYTTYRFHDRNLVLVNTEARVRLFTHVDWAIFAEAGNVAPKIGELNFDRQSYGMGFRMHTGQTTVARMDVAHGDEGWQVLFRVNDPFRFSRVSRRTAPIPFVP